MFPSRLTVHDTKGSRNRNPRHADRSWNRSALERGPSDCSHECGSACGRDASDRLPPHDPVADTHGQEAVDSDTPKRTECTTPIGEGRHCRMADDTIGDRGCDAPVDPTAHRPPGGTGRMASRSLVSRPEETSVKPTRRVAPSGSRA